MEHTQGKWLIAKREGHSIGVRPVIYTKDVDRIAIISYRGVLSIEEADANALLIVDAPETKRQHDDLLAACIKAHDTLLSLHVCDQDQQRADNLRRDIEQAIANAKEVT